MDSEFKAEQLSVFVENRAGRLAEITGVLAAAGINIRGLSLADTSDFGILRLIVRDLSLAEAALAQKGFTTGKTTVVALELPDEPGALGNVLQMLSNDAINVEYMYAVARRDPARACLVFRFDKIDEAIELLAARQVAMIPACELYAV